jgi:hypothetical protein
VLDWPKAHSILSHVVAHGPLRNGTASFDNNRFQAVGTGAKWGSLQPILLARYWSAARCNNDRSLFDILEITSMYIQAWLICFTERDRVFLAAPRLSGAKWANLSARHHCIAGWGGISKAEDKVRAEARYCCLYSEITKAPRPWLPLLWWKPLIRLIYAGISLPRDGRYFIFATIRFCIHVCSPTLYRLLSY